MQKENYMDQTLSVVKKELKALLGDRIMELLLFGSRARGDNAPESDYDILLVVDRVDRKLIDTLDTLAGNLLVNYNALVSLFPITMEERNTKKHSPFLINIAKEGIVV